MKTNFHFRFFAFIFLHYFLGQRNGCDFCFDCILSSSLRNDFVDTFAPFQIFRIERKENFFFFFFENCEEKNKRKRRAILYRWLENQVEMMELDLKLSFIGCLV